MHAHIYIHACITGMSLNLCSVIIIYLSVPQNDNYAQTRLAIPDWQKLLSCCNICTDTGNLFT